MDVQKGGLMGWSMDELRCGPTDALKDELRCAL